MREHGSAWVNLPPPNFSNLRGTRIDRHQEFTFILEQLLHKKLAEELLNSEETVQHRLNFDGLDIIVQSVNDQTKLARLPLWDGAQIIRRKGQIIANRERVLWGPQAPEIVDLRSDIDRLIDAASTFVEFKGRIQECIDRIEGSNHPIWLNSDARNARIRFLHLARTCRAMREDNGSTFGDMQMRGEILGELVAASLTVHRFLNTYREPQS